MSIFTRTPARRWAVPFIAAAAILAGGVAVDGVSASAQERLDPRTPKQLLVDVQQARVDGMSGTLVQKADLGLPELPGAGGSGSSDLGSLVSGSHTLRLWYAGPEKARLALVGRLGESDVIRNGDDLWIWSSQSKSAWHHTLKAHGSSDAAPGNAAPGNAAPRDAAGDLPMTPQRAADRVLKLLEPTTEVSTGPQTTVADRASYQLVLTPRDDATLVRQVRIAIDGETHVPMRVRVYAKGTQDPAFEIGFTSFTPTAPDAAQFRFDPPPGTKVTGGAPPFLKGSPAPGKGDRDHAGPAKPAGPSTPARRQVDSRVVGNGWTSVMVTDAPASDRAGGPSGQLGGMLHSLPKVSGSWGSGRLLSGTLFSAVITDNGRMAVGAVPPERLYAALESAEGQ